MSPPTTKHSAYLCKLCLLVIPRDAGELYICREGRAWVRSQAAQCVGGLGPMWNGATALENYLKTESGSPHVEAASSLA